MRIVFAGTPDFAARSLAALIAAAPAAGWSLPLVLTQPDRPAGRGLRLTPSPVKSLALAHGLTVDTPVSLRKGPEAEAALRRISAAEPDVMIVAAYGLILPQSVLDIPRGLRPGWSPKLTAINVHASLLPRWRGAAPIQRAILAGDTRTGVTIMKMDAGLDTGPMLLVRPLDIGARENAGSLHDRLAALGAEAIVTAIDSWAAGSVVPVAQPPDGATYAAKISKAEAVIDWSRAAGEIARQVRAFNPWPIAETRWQGQQLRIWEAEPRSDGTTAVAGTVVEAANGRLAVAAGSGSLEVHRLQLAGRNATSAAEFLNAHHLLGARLG
jgi:methionyl-tRNA formyltransferase